MDVILSLNDLSYPFPECHKLLISHPVTSKQLSERHLNNLKEISRCNLMLLRPFIDSPDFTLQLTCHLCTHCAPPSPKMLRQVPLPTAAEASYARICLAHSFPGSDISFRSYWSPLSQHFQLLLFPTVSFYQVSTLQLSMA